jgi:hypothetical protein
MRALMVVNLEEVVEAFLLLFWSAVAKATDDANPLQPLDLSSPRATLDNFLNRMDAFYRVLEEEYWDAPKPRDRRAC